MVSGTTHSPRPLRYSSQKSGNLLGASQRAVVLVRPLATWGAGQKTLLGPKASVRRGIAHAPDKWDGTMRVPLGHREARDLGCWRSPKRRAGAIPRESPRARPCEGSRERSASFRRNPPRGNNKQRMDIWAVKGAAHIMQVCRIPGDARFRLSSAEKKKKKSQNVVLAS